MMSSKLKARYRWVAAFLLASAIAHGIEFWQQRARILAAYGDFSALYTAGLLVRRGEGRFLYDRREQWRVQQEFAPNVDIRKGPMPFIRPPFEALVFLPLAHFSYPTALAIWSLAKVVLLWLTARVLPRPRPFTRVYPSWLEVALCLGFFPVFLDLFQGQDAILLLAIVAAALNCLESGKDAEAGVILALALFKFHLVVPIMIMLWLAGRARILVGFLPATAGLVALSCVISGASVLSAYPVYLLNLNREAGVGFVTAQSMPNLRGLLSAFVGRAPYPGPIHWLLFPAAVAGIVLTARLWRPVMNTGFPGLALGYCLALVVAILTSYYCRSYDMTVLIVPLLLLGGGFLEQPGSPPIPRSMIAGLLLVICTPLYWALILRCDCPYLLVVPMFILAFGIARVMRHLGPPPRNADQSIVPSQRRPAARG
jgi:hypothetical protein